MKDAKGHGSDTKGWGHEQHFAEAQRLYKQAAIHEKAGKRKEAADSRASGHEYAAQAKHMFISQRRQAAGVTPAQKMAKGKK